MRKIIISLLVTFICLSTGTSIAQADGMLLPMDFSADYLAVRYHHVTVTIEDGHAVTRVEQEFYNPHSVPIQGRYMFPVPPDTILSDFKATVGGEEQTTTHQGKDATNTALFDMVARHHDPSLLQYIDWETIAFNFDLSAGESRQMSLKYEEVLVPSGGLYHYQYVLSTERYSSKPLDEVTLTIDLESSSGLSTIYSSTHDIAIDRPSHKRAQVSWQAENVNPRQDFELFFAPADGGFGGGLLTGQKDEQNHFLFLFAPEPETSNTISIPKDIVFIVDRSGSMGSDKKIEQARDALKYILSQLNNNDRFSIVSFDDQISVFDPEFQPIKDKALTDARHFVDQLTPGGSTDLQSALQRGIEILENDRRSEASPIILFLTDGQPTSGITDSTSIVDLVTKANSEIESRLHIFGVGYDVNTHLLDRLAEENGGAVTYIQPGENLEAVLTGFYERIAFPVLTNVEIELEGIETSLLYPQHIPDIFHGTSLLLAGQYQSTDSHAIVTVRGRSGDDEQEYKYQFDPSSTGEHDFVPGLWATRRIGDLLDNIRVEGESQDLIEEIRDLGLSYGLVTPYTTFAIEAHAEGAASADNMTLYSDLTSLNQVAGQITIQARVQNQMYLQSDKAGTAIGDNITTNGHHNLAQVSNQNIDLSLLKGIEDFDEPLTIDWINENIIADRQIIFGSDEYFALANNPDIRPLLQNGPNVLFAYDGKIIQVQDTEIPLNDEQSDDRSPLVNLLNLFFTWILQITG